MTDTDDIRRVEGKLIELQEMLDKAEKRRKLKEQERKIDQMQRELKKKMSAKRGKNMKKIDEITRQTQLCETRKDEIFRGRTRRKRVKHEEGLVDENSESIGYITFEAEMEQKMMENCDITVRYVVSNGSATRSVEIRENDKRSEPKSPSASISQSKSKRTKTTEKRDKRSDRNESEPQPSTSRDTMIGQNDSVSDEEQETHIPATMIDESEEEVMNTSVTKSTTRRRRRTIESDDEARVKPKRNKKGHIIYDLKRSEIAKKNYINQMRAKNGTWSHKKEKQLEGQVQVIIPRLQPCDLTTRDTIVRPNVDEKSQKINGVGRPRIMSVEVIRPAENQQTRHETQEKMPNPLITVEQVAQILQEIERKTEETRESQPMRQTDIQAKEDPQVTQTPMEDTRVYYENEGPLADISIQQEMEVETSIEGHEELETTEQDKLPERLKLLEEEVRKAVEELNKDGQDNENKLSEE